MELSINAVVKYNQISPELLAEVRQFLPKKGQTIYFESVRPKARGTTVLPHDRIYDPYKKEYVDIAYVTGNAPGKGETVGRIQFSKLAGGRLQITAGNKDHENKFIYMYLCNFRAENVSDPKTKEPAPWFVASEGRQPVFKLPSAKLTAQDKIRIDREIRYAKNAIDEMGESELRQFALGLDMKGINQHSDPDEIRVQLFKIAESGEGRGAEKIKRLHTDSNLKANILIKEALKAQVLVFNAPLKVWEWADGGEAICVVPDGKKPNDAMITYLLSNKGSKVYEHISTLLEAKKNQKAATADSTQTSTDNTTIPPPAGQAKGGRPPGSKNKSK
jgi:hypothetical protein